MALLPVQGFFWDRACIPELGGSGASLALSRWVTDDNGEPSPTEGQDISTRAPLESGPLLRGKLSWSLSRPDVVSRQRGLSVLEITRKESGVSLLP